MSLKVTSERYNKLLRRKEIVFETVHPSSPTPSRAKVKEELARVLKCKTEMIFIMKMETKGGTWRTVGEVHVYDQPENAKKFVPRYIQARAMKPKEG